MLKMKIDKFMNIIIICLCIAILICVIKFINEYRNASYRYYQSADDYIWFINEKRYSEMVHCRYLGRHLDNPQGELKECIAVAEYYKNASFYKMYEEVGEVQKAEKYFALMDENKKDMDSLSFVIADIHEELHIDFD